MSREKLLERIEGKREELTDLTCKLVRIPTVNPPGDAYTDCARFLGTRLEKWGFEVGYHRAEGTPGDNDRYPRTNLVARLEGQASGPCVHFNGHLDVVMAGKGWTEDPFGAVVKEGRIYGRGTCDMKGGIAAAIIAMESLLEEGISFPGAMEFSGTVDEETGGYGGVAYLAHQGFFSIPPG
jgi:Acetylornithine deacetylase/Succinyl-diaminopimelate desuccinylase and related deacylases